MAVLIDNRQKTVKLSPERILRTAQTILDALGSPEAELSLVIVDDAQIAELNTAYLGREGPTNVIAFPMREGGFIEISPDLIGDVVISAETTVREASEGGRETWQRFSELLIHGILHLFGYDHEQDADRAAQMEVKSQELLQRLEETEKGA